MYLSASDFKPSVNRIESFKMKYLLRVYNKKLMRSQCLIISCWLSLPDRWKYGTTRRLVLVWNQPADAYGSSTRWWRNQLSMGRRKLQRSQELHYRWVFTGSVQFRCSSMVSTLSEPMVACARGLCRHHQLHGFAQDKVHGVRWFWHQYLCLCKMPSLRLLCPSSIQILFPVVSLTLGEVWGHCWVE